MGFGYLFIVYPFAMVLQEDSSHLWLNNNKGQNKRNASDHIWCLKKNVNIPTNEKNVLKDHNTY